ncbi:alcohol dehydrogenase catalytic domain-containing protein [Leifsonia sp. C5G2]|uniref:alcohol dehydrogenase catalytic domain-containing protein n=1 Tax=Leifsonia sp. C5G2 TaxID=2735269 RepID=UPI00158452F6|nr:alcohol dehydrogenase catalytic domain-containing protein [Leifsonia sp. C5G2]NUU05830.1 alcohol dehydrogenase catalytic domain-containing protein [Leifsonia sp. C5G2]
MKALFYERFGGPVTVADLPDPEAPEGGAVVRVEASGLCRSDWHAWVGHDDTVRLPHVPGHEFAGVVAAVGDGVTRWRVGDRVTAPFVNGCGRCEWCLAGAAQVCPQQTQPGFTHWGSHAELVTVRAADTNLVRIPGALDAAAAASLGCRFATAYRAVTARARIQPGEWLAVYGAGGVGLSAVMIASALGARVVAVDRSPAALDLAARLGAQETVLAGADAPDAVVAATGGGAHATVDAVGSADTARAGVLSLRRQGRHVQVGLLATAVPDLPLDRVIGWELEVLGSHGMAAADYPAMLQLVASGRLRPQDLVGGAAGFAEAARLLETADSAPPTGIAVLRPGA